MSEDTAPFRIRKTRFATLPLQIESAKNRIARRMWRETYQRNRVRCRFAEELVAQEKATPAHRISDATRDAFVQNRCGRRTATVDNLYAMATVPNDLNFSIITGHDRKH